MSTRGGRLLIISRELAPSVGPHAIRVTKLAKYLPEFGWEPTIISVPVDHAWALDPTTLGELGATRVVRVRRLLSRLVPPGAPTAGAVPGTHSQGQTDGPGLAGRARRALSSLAIPDRDILWAIPAARRAVREAASFDAVLTTAPPFSTHLVGAWLTRRAEIPWVAEYRDNWSMNPLFRRGAVRRAVEQRLEAFLLRRAAAVVAASDAAAREIATTFPKLRGHIHVAMNGFDPDDLPTRQGTPLMFEIAYAGTLDERRDPRNLIEVLERRSASDPGFAEALRLRLIGNVAAWIGDVARSKLGSDRVRLDGLVPHREALKLAAGAAILLGITTRSEAGGSGLTSKLFEYLGLRRPVLMLAPPGPARDLVDELHAGAVADSEDLAAISAAIAELYDNWRAGTERVASEAALSRYTRRETARRVAEALDAACGRRHGS